MNKIKFILFLASIMFATVFTLSCSGEGGGGGGGGGEDPDDNGVGSVTETHTLTYLGDGYFSSYVSLKEQYYCTAGGVLETIKDSSKTEQHYSIDNKIMTLETGSGDTLIFKGSSNELKGTWTRTRNKASSCEVQTDDDNPWYECKDGYDITKMVFTDSKVTITSEECPTDEKVDGRNYGNGWKLTIVNCNTIEISKGLDKVTQKITKTGTETSYKGSSCKNDFNSKTLKQAACKKAWDQYHDEKEYFNIMVEESRAYDKCLKKLLPELFDNGNEAK